MCASEEEEVSKSNALRNTADSYEGGKLLTLSMSIFVPLELVMLYKVSQIQDFDVRWDEALLSASDMPSDVIVEGLHKSKMEDAV